MAGHQESQSARIFLETIETYNDHSLAEFLFPIDGSEAPRITQAIADKVRSSNLKERVDKAFLVLMKGYGFYRRLVQPIHICLRPSKSKTVNWKAQTWISDEHPEHARIARIILLLRVFDLHVEAQAFFAALTSENRITTKVSLKNQLRWKAAIDEDIPKYLAENPSEDGSTSESSDRDSLFDESEPLSLEQQQLLERLIREGTKEFAGRKRSRNEEEGDNNEPPTKRQKTDPCKPIFLEWFIPCACTMQFSEVPRLIYESRTFSEPLS